MKKISYKKIFSIIAVLSPALNVYGSLVPNIELGTFTLLLLLGIAIVSHMISWKINTYNIPWFLFIIITGVTSAYSIISLQLSRGEIVTVFFRYMKILVAVMIVILVAPDWFDLIIGLKTMIIFNEICSVVIIIQTIFFYFTGSSPIGFYTASAGFIRPSCFFYEPAHYAAYALVCFNYLLYTIDKPKQILRLLLIAIGICLSTSGTGIILMPVMVSIHFIIHKKIKVNRKEFIGTISMFILIVGVGVAFLNTSIGQSSIGRFMLQDGTLGPSVNGRFKSGAQELFLELPLLYKIIGCGFGDRTTEVYFPSLYAILYGDGYIGLFLVAVILVWYFMNGNLFQKKCCITYAALMTGTGVFNFGSILIYFLFICSNQFNMAFDQNDLRRDIRRGDV